jgi:hypothetical protein
LDRILLIPKYVSSPYQIIGTISRTKGVAIEFVVAKEGQNVEIRWEEKPVEDLFFSPLGRHGFPLFVVQGSNNIVENVNIITQEFYLNNKEFIDNLSRCTNLILEGAGSVLKLESGDIRLVDVTLSYVDEDEEKVRHFDCLWLFESTSSSYFSKESAENLAQIEYQRIISIASGKIPVTLLAASLREYGRLLDNQEISEEQMQVFLENNPIILDVTTQRMFPKQRFGEKFVADFLIERSDFRYIIVEIEKPSDELYTNEKPPRPSRKLREAETQIKETLTHVRNNVHYFKQNFPIMSVENLRGLVVIGRGDKLVPDHKRRLREDNAFANEYEIITFDELFNKVRTLLENLGMRYSHSS